MKDKPPSTSIDFGIKRNTLPMDDVPHASNSGSEKALENIKPYTLEVAAIQNKLPRILEGYHFLAFNTDTGNEEVYTENNVTMSAIDRAYEQGKINEKSYIELLRTVGHSNEAKIHALEAERGIDPLTGIFNRRFLDRELKKSIDEMNRSNDQRHSELNAVMVVFFDLNNFKFFNEEPYNHKIGDKALVAFVDRLRAVTKEGEDILFRFAGDEFIVVMKLSGNKFKSDEIFTRLKEEINKDLFIQVGKQQLPITASMGYSLVVKGDAVNTEELINGADAAERQDKQKGKQ